MDEYSIIVFVVDFSEYDNLRIGDAFAFLLPLYDSPILFIPF
jgi:hypothetical protein